MKLILFALGLGMVASAFALFPTHWPKLLIGTCAVFLLLAPQILAAVIDPIVAWRISRYVRPLGATNVRVKLFPNHYGVHFDLKGRSFYLKCLLKKGKVTWRGKNLSDVATEVGIVLPNKSLERTRGR